MSAARLRFLALASLAAAAAFTLFFFSAKHRPAFAGVAPFGEDPYDAVGSFALQLAGVAAALSTLRALRGSTGGRISSFRGLLILRGAGIALLAVFVALLADLVAMARHPAAWLASPAGHGLLALLALFTLASAGGLIGIVRTGKDAEARPRPPSWAGAVATGGMVALLLAFYPEAWRRGLAGAILTALFGTVLLFVSVRIAAGALLSQDAGPSEDLLDDLSALLGKSEALSRRLRARPWRVVVLAALAGGLALALVQAVGEGLPPTTGRALLFLGVFTGLEAAGILLGCVLFRRLLGLIRPG